MGNFYYIATLLPVLEIGIRPELTFSEYDTLLKLNLNKREYSFVKRIKEYHDLENIRLSLKEKPISRFGNYDRTELREHIHFAESFPPYIQNYLNCYQQTSERLQYFPELLFKYWQQKCNQNFLDRYFKFETQLQLIQIYLRSKHLNKNYLNEWPFHEEKNEKMREEAEIISLKGFDDLKKAFEFHATSPLELHRSICQYRLDWIQKEIGEKLVSLEGLLGYLLQLIIVEKWNDLKDLK